MKSPVNNQLQNAKTAKKDEFYTQITDIEKEMIFYKEHFIGKTIFCNCDDPLESHFWKYFYLNFELLGLKKLVSTHFSATKPSYKLEITSPNQNPIKTPLIGNGDFRSPESIEILKESDIVITNPPFSLFREYIAQLFEYEKKFIILGNMNATTYKDVFNLFKDNKLWFGKSIKSGDREFRVPDDYPLNAAGYRIDQDGNKYIRVKGVRWFTNLEYKDRKEDITLYKKYYGNESEYPTYDNVAAIEIPKTKLIPEDYFEMMGVPITFLDKYNPDQFIILGNEYDLNVDKGRCYIDGKRLYSRIFIKRK